MILIVPRVCQILGLNSSERITQGLLKNKKLLTKLGKNLILLLRYIYVSRIFFTGFYNLSELSIQNLDHSAELLFVVLTIRSDRQSRNLFREVLDKNNLEPGLSMKRQVVFALGLGNGSLNANQIANLKAEQNEHNDLLMFCKKNQ